MKAVFIVDKSKIAKVLIDPMRRAILDLLRQKPMTQTQLANELGLSPPSLNYHIKLLKSIDLVVIARKQVEAHGITQIFYSSIAYFFVYDLDSLPRDIGRYFYPLSLERLERLSLFFCSRINRSRLSKHQMELIVFLESYQGS